MTIDLHLDPAIRMLLLSNSRDRSGNYLVHARPAWTGITSGRKRALFFPFAGTTIEWDAYLELVRQALAAQELELDIVGAHRCDDIAAAIAQTELLLVGGGNTFRLLHALRTRGCLEPMRQAVRAGLPYIGWSAGSIVATPSIATTNDMPIIDPGGFDALGLVPLHINAHYTNALPPGHQGETRNQRIAEYQCLHPDMPVLALPEGNWLEIRTGEALLQGPHASWLFHPGCEPQALNNGRLVLG